MPPAGLYVDNHYAVDGVHAILSGRNRPYLDSIDADLWRHFIAAGPHVTLVWVPAHLERDEAVCRGVPKVAGEGNRRADAAAKVAVIGLAPLPALVEAC